MTTLLAIVAALPPALVALAVAAAALGSLFTVLGAVIPRVGPFAAVQAFCSKAGVTVGHVGDLLHKAADSIPTTQGPDAK
jgi:hypothetical protein